MLTLTQLKSKSAARLKGLHPAVRAAAQILIERCCQRGIPILITQGLRTVGEQNVLYAQGRTAKGAIVTNARGGYSYHNYGLAVDFALLLQDGRTVSWDTGRDGNGDAIADWLEVVREAKALGFEWGGDWTSFRDYPHLQITFGLSLAQLRGGAQPSAASVEVLYQKINKEGEKQNMKTEHTAVVQVNGVKVADGMLNKGITYVPVRSLAEALGAQVRYIAATRTVEVTSSQLKGNENE